MTATTVHEAVAGADLDRTEEQTILESFSEEALRVARPEASSGLERRLGIASVLRALCAEPERPVQVGRFLIQDKLGEGAMGIVFRAHDPELDRTVAIKFVRSAAGSEEQARIRAEARALGRVTDPHVVVVHDAVTAGDDMYLTMEYVPGQNLSDWLATHPNATWSEIVGVFAQAARGLAAAHRAGIVHRDFKPANVLVGDDGRVRVVDFGLARPERALKGGALAGTPHFMAPEVWTGAPSTFASDQFAFCIALADALDPEHKPDGWNAGSPGLHAFIGRGLHRDPSRRWPSMDALIDVLEEARNPRPDNRLRSLLVSRVERLWLQRDAAPVPLTIADVAGVVIPPWSEMAVAPASSRLSTIRHLSGVLDRAHGSLLLLGAPGGGKTTALLSLAKDLIADAKVQTGASVPVVLNLSSFRPERVSVFEWIQDEMSTKYSLPKTATRRWLEGDGLILLLDGLDEVPPDRRRACVEALNQLRSEHTVPVVVTCRDEEYRAIGEKLRFGAAVRVVPPDDAALEAIVAQREGGTLMQRLRDDTALRERMRNPLLLTLLTRGGDGGAAGLSSGDTGVYGHYVAGAFGDQSSDQRARSIRALAWLASAMRRRGVSDLWLERLDPQWLENRAEQVGARGLGIALVIGIQAAIALAVGVALGRSVGFIALMVAVPIVAVARNTRGYRIGATEALRWSWTRAMKKLPQNLPTAFFVGLVTVYLGASIVTLKTFVFFALVLGLVAALEPSERETRVRPNEGTRRSLFYAVLVSVCTGPPAAAFAALALVSPGEGLARDLLTSGHPRLTSFFYTMTFSMLILFMLYGGVMVLSHIAVRAVLALRTPLPLALVPFLDECADRGILRRVGGGYMFLHRTLLEHFADRWDGGRGATAST